MKYISLKRRIQVLEGVGASGPVQKAGGGGGGGGGVLSVSGPIRTRRGGGGGGMIAYRGAWDIVQ